MGNLFTQVQKGDSVSIFLQVLGLTGRNDGASLSKIRLWPGKSPCMKPKLNRIHPRGGFQRLGLELLLSTLISVGVLCSGLTPPAVAQVQFLPNVEQGLAVTTISQTSTPTNPQSTGTINGTVLDEAGAVAVGARVQLTRPGESQSQEVVSGEAGQFTFGNVLPGPFQLTITAPGFGTKLFSGVLQPGTAYFVPAHRAKDFVYDHNHKGGGQSRRSGGNADQAAGEATSARHCSQFLCFLRCECGSLE